MSNTKFIKKEDPKLNTYKINWSSDFESQVESVLEDISINEDQRYEVNIIENKLKSAIHTVWPDAEISKYGSIATGLSLNCSDIDFSIDTPQVTTTPSYLSTITSLLSRTPDFDYPESHEYPVPFISVVYTPTRRFFDITFNNDRAKATTELITEIINTDVRIKQLMMLVKFWCKVQGMVGHKRLTCMITYMLVIFYLQVEGVIPSIASMMDTENCKYVEGYNVALKRKYFERKQDKSILQLLGGFFEFYANFAWSRIVISPFAGKPFERSQYGNGGANLPEIFKDFKNDSNNSTLVNGYPRLTVQNPLFLSQNLTASIDYKFFNYFNLKLGQAAMCYRAGISNNHKNFLRRILVK